MITTQLPFPALDRRLEHRVEEESAKNITLSDAPVDRKSAPITQYAFLFVVKSLQQSTVANVEALSSQSREKRSMIYSIERLPNVCAHHPQVDIEFDALADKRLGNRWLRETNGSQTALQIAACRGCS